MKQNYTSDIVLLQGISAGADEAIAVVYKRYYPYLKKWLQTKGAQEADAEDIFQEALMVLYQQAQNPSFCLTCQLSTYLFGICKRLWWKQLKSQAGKYDEEIDDDIIANQNADEDIAHYLQLENQFSQLDQALNQLGSPCKELLQAFYMQEKSMLEIAQQFGYTNADNAKNQKYKCFQRLKKYFLSLSSSDK